MGRLLGFGFQSQPDHFGNFFIADFSRSTTAWQVENAGDAAMVKAFAQPTDGVRTKAGFLADLAVIQTFGTSQDHACSQRLGLGSFGTPADGLQLLAFFWG